MTAFRLGVDIGGTFTDIVLVGEDGTLYSKKVLSTPDDYSRAIEEGVAALLREEGVAASAIVEFAHGTTIATNAIIERKGVTVALLTTKGFRDVLEIGRFRAPRLYDLSFRKPEPLVERRLRFEVPERVSGSGEILKPIDLAALDRIVERLVALGVRTVAICFVNSYVNPANELAALRHLRERLPAVSVSASVELVPQIQEYERTSTTVVNAYIRPVVEGYVTSLSRRMSRIGIKVPLLIMQSSGGVLPAALAGASPVYIIESGPAAGVVGAQRIGQRFGLGDLMVLDMGGTTAKAALIQDGEFGVMPEAELGGTENAGHRLIQGAGYVVQVPTIDIAEVGAGGGSIAEIDTGGGVKVGPRSAGASPGPVCYDLGGVQPTVTDANLLLGYLNPRVLVGGDLPLDFGKAEAAIAGLGRSLGQSTTDTAYGIHLIANANMMRALRAVSSERGRDPSQFTLVAIGGNGGVHAAALAETLGIGRVIVPPVAGLFSALGLLFADVEHQLIRAFYRAMRATTAEALNEALAPMVEEAHALLKSEGFARPGQRRIEVYANLRYAGQTWTLTVPFVRFPADDQAMTALAEGFHRTHDQNYGYRSDHEPIQFVALKVLGRGVADRPRLPERVREATRREAERSGRKAYFGPGHGWLATPVLPRPGLDETARPGPLIVEEYDCTTVVRPGWRARRDSWNNIVIERG
ncbi:MAG: hydantoinase/oxoprolinase family protein [Proteobacteria bacterium]|nr:hydantoinase/oxoprolinase family protein [Pseudomonadota bacterium]